MGYVDKDVDDLLNRFGNLGVGMGGNNDLGAIEEGSEDESEDEDEDIFDSKESAPQRGNYDLKGLQDAFFVQAFSHFTYEKSKNFFMVVDLQGVLTINNDGTKCYERTDPVIHKHRSKKNQKQWSFGRTDRGEKGMLAFFETHKCTQACKLLGLTEVEIRGDHLHYVK